MKPSFYAALLSTALGTALAANDSATTTMDLYILPVESQQALNGLQGAVIDVDDSSDITKFAVELQPSETRTLTFNPRRSEWSYRSDGVWESCTVNTTDGEEAFTCDGSAPPPIDGSLSDYYVPVTLTEGVELLAVETTSSSTTASTPTPTNDNEGDESDGNDEDEDGSDDDQSLGSKSIVDTVLAGFALAAFVAVL
jgi:hypothetical protein